VKISGESVLEFLLSAFGLAAFCLGRYDWETIGKSIFVAGSCGVGGWLVLAWAGS